MKQKRYKVRKVSNTSYKLSYSNNLQSSKVLNDQVNFFNQHLRKREKILNTQVSKRLLRTRRVLVLPAHVNLAVISNSFDVIHSWYIPGLGVKLDCVPGRSTHHTLHIDHAGFYYGQCAEICGRYHHHMPIRVCALPFEHFCLWWAHFGAPYFLDPTESFNYQVKGVIKDISM